MSTLKKIIEHFKQFYDRFHLYIGFGCIFIFPVISYFLNLAIFLTIAVIFIGFGILNGYATKKYMDYTTGKSDEQAINKASENHDIIGPEAGLGFRYRDELKNDKNNRS